MEEQIRSRAENRMTPTQIADDLGLTRRVVTSRINRAGIPVTRMQGTEKFTSHRDFVQTMRLADAVEYLLEVIEMAHLDNDREHTFLIRDHGYTMQEAIVLSELIRAEGRTCRRDHLYDALYRGRLPEECPEPKILDVRLVKIRRRLPPGIRIDTIWGVGYRLERDSGAVFPWEKR